MDKRTEIALIYSNSKKWIAGAYYIQNIVHAINTLSDEKKPKINLYSSEQDYYDLCAITKYPYIEHHILEEGLIFKKCNIFLTKIYKFLCPYSYKYFGGLNIFNSNNVLVYPCINYTLIKTDTKLIAWIADLQEKHLPDLFDKKELAYRESKIRMFVKNKLPIVFSSKDSENDFKKFYPNSTNKTFILRFAVTHPDFSGLNIHAIKEKHGINGEYMFCANQFWVHKNHLFLFRVFKKYLDQGHDMQLVCTGELFDFRDKTYAASIRAFIKDNSLEDRIKIIGFVDREEQLCLMDNSYAIIQPSLFEGWSTVVEDAKALNKFIFLSNLNVHKEQDPCNVSFFDPYDEIDLLNKLNTVKQSRIYHDYSQNIRDFGENFLDIINYISLQK